MEQARRNSDIKDEAAPEYPALPSDLDIYLPAKLLRPLHEPRFNRRAWGNALNHLRSLRYLLSTYIPSHLAQTKLLQPTVGQPAGEWLDGSLLFSDVSGFTALSERLAHQGQEGAEQLTRAINAYFERMLDILAWSGGVLLKFAGDALLVYFPADKDGAHTAWAVRAGQRMMRAMSEFTAIPTALGPVALKMKIGVSTGPFAALSIGSAKRMEYVLLGDPVTRVMGAEGAATAGQIVVDSATFAQLAPTVFTDLGNGFYAVEEEPDETLDDFEIRAQTGRARRAEGSAFTPVEMAADMHRLVDQIAALTPYLPHPLVERIIDASDQRHIESEYRLTTVLFTNVTGFESLLPGDNAPLDHVTGLMSDYFNALHTIVARYDGVITRIDPYSKGSKVLILFGAPVAHEDDPERGTRTALEMMAELATLNARWQHARWQTSDPVVQQRVGITHGLTFAGQAGAAARREYTVMGDDVNLAARLMSAGTPGQILLAPSVYAKVSVRFAITALPAIRVKGKTDPIPIYQVDGLARENPLAGRLRDLSPLLGRETELATALELLRNALAGHGTRLALRGPAGIGKSHLAYTLAAHALEMGAQVVMAECHAYAAETPYNVWTSLLHTLAGFTTDEDPRQRSEKLYAWLTKELGMTDSRAIDALFTLLSLRNPHPPALIPPASRETETSVAAKPPARAGLFAQLGQKVSTVPAKPREGPPAPNLWKLAQERQEAERLKSGSAPMWQRLEARVTARERERLFAAVSSLVEQLTQRAPLVLLVENAQWMDTLSRELLDYLQTQIGDWPALIVLAQRTEEDTGAIADKNTLILHPLGETGTCDLVKSMLQAEEIPDIATLCQSIHRHSEGNPLFIEEIVRWMQRTGCTTSESVETGLHSSDVLQELIISRVDSLPYGERVAAKDASIVGDDFHASDLAPLQDVSVDDAHLNSSLTGLESAQMVLQTSPADVHYAFRQTVTREFIYNSQPFDKRRTQHARLAEYLERRYAAVLATYAELLAHHYAAAQRWLSAARYLILSGDKARQRYAFPQAAACYRHALEMLERLPAQIAASDHIMLTLRAHTGLGDVALLTGDFGAATTHYSTVRQISAPETPAMVLVKLALTLPTQGQAAEAIACAREAWSLSPLDDAPCLLAASAVLAWLLWRAEDDNARAWIDYARPLAAAPTDRWTAGIAALLDDLSGAWEAAQRAYLALGHTDGAALAACRQGDRALHDGDVAAALAHYESAADLWKQDDDPTGLALARYRQAEAYRRDGQNAAARAALKTAQALLGDGDEANREVIQAALDSITADSTLSWSPWRWQAYDNACRILLLFPF